MPVEIPAPRASVTRRVAGLVALYALVGGVTSLAGWVLDIQRLTDWENDGIAIQPNATLCVIFSALALLALERRRHRIATACGTVVLVIGGLTLLQWVTGLSFGIDGALLFGREWGRVGIVVPGRMGPPGSFAWTLIGNALILSAGSPRRHRWVPALALTTASISALSLIGYLYDVDRLYSLPYLTVIALQTSSFIMALSVGIIVRHPEREPMRTLLDPGAAGLLARRALPLMLLVPVVVGLLRVKGQDAGLYDTGLGSALVSLVTIGFLVGLMWWVLKAVRAGERALRDSEAPLRESEARLSKIFQTVGVSLWEEDFSGVKAAVDELRTQGVTDFEKYFRENPDFVQRAMAAIRVTDVNETTLRMFEARDKSELLGSLPQIFPPQSMHVFLGELQALADGKTYLEAEAVLNTVRGRPIHVLFTMVLPEPDQPFDRVLFSVVDITTRKMADAALRESEERFRGVGQAIPMIVSLGNADGEIEYVSPYWQEFSGRSPNDFISGGWHDAIHPDHRQYVLNKQQEALASKMPYEYEFMARNSGGEYRWLLARGVPVLGDDGAVVNWVNVAADIHQRRQAEESLKEADRRKDEFLATLAHELRNPLAPVRNAIQVLHMRGPAVPELQWARDVIDRQMQQMTRLIDDLMDVSRISRGKIELKRERVLLATVIQGAIETSRPLIEQGHHQLTVRLPSEAIYLEADLLRMAQVFSNLLNNAAKYTEPGGAIKLLAKVQGSDVIVSVADTGIGIPRDKLESVFEMFSQVQGALERSQGGLGIGLSLVKRLVEMHGGTIDAHSAGPGMGSEFVVRLPISAEPLSTQMSGDSDNLHVATTPLRILVVDDNQDAADTLATMLRLTDNETRIAFDGENALRVADEFRPQVVLLDIGLPKLNGYEVCRRIRHREWGKDALIVALTGWGHDEDKRKAEEAGFDQHLVKPVDPRDVIKLVASAAVTEPPA